MVFNSSMLMAGATANASDYTIPYSARFVSGNSPGLSRAWASGNRTTATLSLWFKIGKIDSTTRELVSLGSTSGTSNDLIFCEYVGVSNIFQIYYYNSGVVWQKSFTQVLRDPSAWYHLVVAFDTTNGTAGDRVIPYLNGSRVTALGTSSNPTASANQPFNVSGGSCYIGKEPAAAGYWDGYVSQVQWIDGQALTPSSFGQTNTSGVWVPKAYAGTYGTNGFFLAFGNSAALGTDTSGNANTFTSSGLTSADQVTDTPTNVRATWNPIFPVPTSYAGTMTWTAGNKVATFTSGVNSGFACLTQEIPVGMKAAIELTLGAGTWTGASERIGIFASNANLTAGGAFGAGATEWCYRGDGQKINNGSASAYGTAWAATNVITVEVDNLNGTLRFRLNGTDQGQAYTFTPTPLVIGAHSYNSKAITLNNETFAQPVTSGFSLPCTSNLPAPAIKDGSAHFQTTLYTGTGATLLVHQTGNADFTPDMVWLKSRSAATDNLIFDVLRGVNKYVRPNAVGAELTVTDGLMSFDSDGFTLGADIGTSHSINDSAKTYAAWQWKAGGAGVTNSVGSITSTVSANTTAGFSVVTYTGTGTAGTIGHGLGVAPKLIIVKARSGVTQGWHGYHASLGNGSYVVLNTTAAVDTGAIWNSASPDSSKFSVGSSTWPQVNSGSGTYVAYCFAEIAGFSKIGSYTGNGSADGPFVYCGFRPAFVLTKRSDSADSWVIKDTARDTYNVATKRLYTEQAAAEDPSSLYGTYDILSNGFKFRDSNGLTNGSGGTYVFAAFASNPFGGGSGAAPATAR